MNENAGTEQTCIRNTQAGKLSIISETENIFQCETKKNSLTFLLKSMIKCMTEYYSVHELLNLFVPVAG